MNRTSHEDEYQEVESPFAPRSTEKSNSRDRLRTRKNVFNRPFATEPTSAPLIVEPKAARRSIGRVDDFEMLESRQSELANAEIDYLDEQESEEEEAEKRPARVTTKKTARPKKNILPKIGWSVVGILVLRLIFMDRGVWDYFATESTIREKQDELRDIRTENKELKTEIVRIRSDMNFQRQLAKEHLGVIAVDEFLILFAGESSDSGDIKPNQI